MMDIDEVSEVRMLQEGEPNNSLHHQHPQAQDADDFVQIKLSHQ